MGKRTLVFSESVLLPPDQQPAPTVEAEALWHSYLKPGEEAEGENAPLRTVAKKGGLKATEVHELTHMALYGRKDLPEPALSARTLYARFNDDEWNAERLAAEYLGEGDLLVPEEKPGQLAQFDSNWQYLRDKSVADGLPQGPHEMYVHKYDLNDGSLRRRLKTPVKSLPVEITYRLVPDTDSSAVAA